MTYDVPPGGGRCRSGRSSRRSDVHLNGCPGKRGTFYGRAPHVGLVNLPRFTIVGVDVKEADAILMGVFDHLQAVKVGRAWLYRPNEGSLEGDKIAVPLDVWVSDPMTPHFEDCRSTDMTLGRFESASGRQRRRRTGRALDYYPIPGSQGGSVLHVHWEPFGMKVHIPIWPPGRPR
jgi:hypothetical protein